MNKLAQWGNELYTGKRSYPFVAKRKLWFSIAAVLMVLSAGSTFSLHILEVGMHNTIAANIASQSAESSGVQMSRLIFTGLVLFIITFIINSIARWIVDRRKEFSGAN